MDDKYDHDQTNESELIILFGSLRRMIYLIVRI